MGVTEPAMFGINLKYVYPFLAAMVGSAFGGMLITATNTRALGIGVGRLPGFLSFQIKRLPNGFPFDGCDYCSNVHLYFYI